jgi:probable HAF family extracellular repeat protein
MNKSMQHVCIAAMLAASSTAALAAPRYTVTDLGSYPGSISAGTAGINASGQIAGTSYGIGTGIGGFVPSFGTLFSGGSVTDLGKLPSAQIDYTGAYGINNSGQVVGTTQGGLTGYQPRAFVWTAGIMQDLGVGVGASDSYGSAINNKGDVVGYNGGYQTATSRAFLYSGGVMQDLGPAVGSGAFYANTAAFGINDAGQVTGFFQRGGQQGAFFYSAGAFYEIGSLGGTFSAGYAINSSGQIAGYSQNVSGDIHATLYSNFVLQDFGTLPGLSSYGTALNDFGVMVGISEGNGRVGFVSGAGQLLALNDLIDPISGWNIAQATGINNAGQISAIAYRADAAYRSFAVRLDPIPDVPVAGVPEPASWVMLIAGFGLTGAAARRRRTAAAIA